MGAGFTNDEGQKVAVSSQELVPSAVILDAKLTLDTPERLWYAFMCLDAALSPITNSFIGCPLV